MAPRPIATTLAATLLRGIEAADHRHGGDGWSPAEIVLGSPGVGCPQQQQRWLPGHRGVDLRASVGERVRAAGDGRVAFVGTLAGRGVITINHGDLRTTYEPVEALVRVGERVRAGQSIGTVGTGTGHCGSGRCLHLGLRRGREYLNPMLLLGRASARLRPW